MLPSSAQNENGPTCETAATVTCHGLAAGIPVSSKVTRCCSWYTAVAVLGPKSVIDEPSSGEPPDSQRRKSYRDPTPAETSASAESGTGVPAANQPDGVSVAFPVAAAAGLVFTVKKNSCVYVQFTDSIAFAVVLETGNVTLPEQLEPVARKRLPATSGVSLKLKDVPSSRFIVTEPPEEIDCETPPIVSVARSPVNPLVENVVLTTRDGPTMQALSKFDQ